MDSAHTKSIDALFLFTGSTYGHFHFLVNLLWRLKCSGIEDFTMLTKLSFMDETFLLDDAGLSNHATILRERNRWRRLLQYIKLTIQSPNTRVIFNTKLFGSWHLTLLISVLCRLAGKSIIWIVHEYHEGRNRTMGRIERAIIRLTYRLASRRVALSTKVESDLRDAGLSCTCRYHPVYDLVQLYDGQEQLYDSTRAINVIVFNPRFYKGLKRVVSLANEVNDGSVTFTFIGQLPSEERRHLDKHLDTSHALVMDEYLNFRDLVNYITQLVNPIHLMEYERMDTTGALMLFATLGVPSVTTRWLAGYQEVGDLIWYVEPKEFTHEKLYGILTNSHAIIPERVRQRYGWNAVIQSLVL